MQVCIRVQKEIASTISILIKIILLTTKITFALYQNDDDKYEACTHTYYGSIEYRVKVIGATFVFASIDRVFIS